MDRSAAYLARQVAKSVVAAGLAARCIFQVSYAIGVPEPLSVFVDTYGTGKIPDSEILDKVKAAFDFRPGLIAKNLDLMRATTDGGGQVQEVRRLRPLGRDDPDFTWETVVPLK